MRAILISTSSRIALGAAILCTSSAANAASFTIGSGQTVTTQQTVAGTDQGVVQSGGTLNVTASAILWNGAANAPGINVTNNGTINSGVRGIDTSGAVSGVFTLQNTGAITGVNDTFRINTALTNSTVIVNNAGTMTSQTGQVIDFAAIVATTNSITITNSGTMRSTGADAVRPGANGTVNNSGIIESTSIAAAGDGVDFQSAGGTVNNAGTGQILGAKHGVTGDTASTITNAAGGLIAGANGSGVNFDNGGVGAGVVTITNRGTIRGAASLLGPDDDGGAPDGVPDGDGDGVDADGQIVVNNFGTIQGTGATGTNDGVANTADGIAAGGGAINNFQGGLIEAFDNVGVNTGGRAILIDDSAQGPAPFATTVLNQGTIRSDGAAITFIGVQNDTIDNFGLISSGATVGVDMGDGDDTFISRVGSSLIGAVSGGAGSDTLALAGTGGTFVLGELSNAGTYRFFETLAVQSGASYAATGSSAFAGAVAVDGALRLDGSLAAASATVAGTLSGAGTIGALSIQSGGVLAPGNQGVGTLNVTNAASFAAGSTYEVDVVGATSDSLIVGGTATLGGTVAVTPVNLRITDTFQILSANLVTGTFSSVTAPTLFATPTLAYTPTTVTLSFTRNAVAFESFAETRNQRAVAQVFDGAAANSDLASYLGGATDADVYRQSLDLLSGEAHASLQTTLFAQNTLVADTVMSRLRQAAAAPGGAQTAALSAGGPALAYASDAPVTTAFNDMKAPYAAAPVSAGPVVATWAQGFGQWSKADGRNGSSRVEGSLGGFMAGADVTDSGLTFGLAGGYVSADSDVDALRSKLDADTALVAAYAGAAFDAVRLRGGASYGWSDIDSRRSLVVGGLAESPRASYDGSTANAFAEAAYVVALGAAEIEPYAQLAWSRVETDSFTERNAPVAGLSVGKSKFDTVYTTLGARFAATVESGMGLVTPHATLAWRHTMDDVTPTIAAGFTNAGGSFTAAGAPIGKDSLLVGAGVDVGLSANALIGVAYEGQFASDARYNAVKGRFAYRF